MQRKTLEQFLLIYLVSLILATLALKLFGAGSGDYSHLLYADGPFYCLGQIENISFWDFFSTESLNNSNKYFYERMPFILFLNKLAQFLNLSEVKFLKPINALILIVVGGLFFWSILKELLKDKTIQILGILLFFTNSNLAIYSLTLSPKSIATISSLVILLIFIRVIKEKSPSIWCNITIFSIGLLSYYTIPLALLALILLSYSKPNSRIKKILTIILAFIATNKTYLILKSRFVEGGETHSFFELAQRMTGTGIVPHFWPDSNLFIYPLIVVYSILVIYAFKNLYINKRLFLLFSLPIGLLLLIRTLVPSIGVSFSHVPFLSFWVMLLVCIGIEKIKFKFPKSKTIIFSLILFISSTAFFKSFERDWGILIRKTIVASQKSSFKVDDIDTLFSHFKESPENYVYLSNSKCFFEPFIKYFQLTNVKLLQGDDYKRLQGLYFIDIIDAPLLNVENTQKLKWIKNNYQLELVRNTRGLSLTTRIYKIKKLNHTE